MTVGVTEKVKLKVRSKLGELLDEKLINKAQLARTIGVAPKMIYEWCKNNDDGQAVSTPSVGYVLRLKKTLGVDIEDMYEEV